MANAIEISDLKVCYKDRVVLERISLEVREGDFLGIIGKNGSGKTTLLKSILCFSDYQGEIVIFGRDNQHLSAVDRAKLISYVPQRKQLYFPFRVKDFVSLSRYAYANSFWSKDPARAEKTEHALELLQIGSISERTIDTLSGGELQKVYLASAVAQESKIILLDEPSTFLDPSAEDEIYELLARINKELSVTVVVVSHNINHTLSSSNRVVALESGNVFFDGTCDELLSQGVLNDVFSTNFVEVIHPHTNKQLVLPSC